MSETFPSPTVPMATRTDVFLVYLDYFRGVVVEKLRDLHERELGQSRLPSGWTPLQLVKHLTYVERRWLVWGFLGEPVPDPWGDAVAGVWTTRPDEGLAELLAALDAQAAVTRAVVASHDLTEVGAPGERWDGAPPATLERILFHLLQEYARHVGHLDVVRELVDGRVGE